jgi:hypothetical protein
MLWNSLPIVNCEDRRVPGRPVVVHVIYLHIIILLHWLLLVSLIDQLILNLLMQYMVSRVRVWVSSKEPQIGCCSSWALGDWHQGQLVHAQDVVLHQTGQDPPQPGKHLGSDH